MHVSFEDALEDVDVEAIVAAHHKNANETGVRSGFLTLEHSNAGRGRFSAGKDTKMPTTTQQVLASQSHSVTSQQPASNCVSEFWGERGQDTQHSTLSVNCNRCTHCQL